MSSHEIFKNTFFNKTPPVAASEDCKKVVITWNIWSPKVGFVTVQCPRFYYDGMVLLCNMFYVTGFFLLLVFSLKHNLSFYNTHQMRFYHLFIVEVIVESVNLIPMLK